ncbi:hypothetical protein [Haloarcula marismortui]|uniref:Uncharacterized protein n=1 Tax=Haloarcula marismortui ATCC 33800 TaxID=662476 RepID=A0A8T8KME7_9EURY|nr:hypothetical protein [Haloarcula sinaiiensis]QUJ75017.1 hypothetical protein KDQ40_22480 [Haloarcula sinaiiensis ATCC 33800]
MRECGPAGPGETGAEWLVGRDSARRQRSAPLGAIARLAAVHRACGSGRDPGLPPGGGREPLLPVSRGIFF